jgi:hypothetical protein
LIPHLASLHLILSVNAVTSRSSCGSFPSTLPHFVNTLELDRAQPPHKISRTLLHCTSLANIVTVPINIYYGGEVSSNFCLSEHSIPYFSTPNLLNLFQPSLPRISSCFSNHLSVWFSLLPLRNPIYSSPILPQISQLSLSAVSAHTLCTYSNLDIC